MGEGAWDLQNR